MRRHFCVCKDLMPNENVNISTLKILSFFLIILSPANYISTTNIKMVKHKI